MGEPMQEGHKPRRDERIDDTGGLTLPARSDAMSPDYAALAIEFRARLRSIMFPRAD